MTELSLRKLIAIAALALATLIPSGFTAGLIDERSARQDEVQNEFATSWGPKQQLYAPILVIPFQPAPDTSHQPPQERARRYLGIATSKLAVDAKLAPQERRRGLFHATVYDAQIDMQGRFAIPDEARLREIAGEDGRFLWSDAFIAFGATALIGMRPEDHIAIDGVTMPWAPCLEVVAQEWACRGVPLVLAELQPALGTPLSGSVAFSAALSLRGTQSFGVVASGKELQATVRSPWSSPSFGGNVLPVGSSVGDQGFEARWQNVEFGSPRMLAATGIVETVMTKGNTIGVELIEATPIYRMISRTAKYDLLLIALAFATYLFFELLARIRIHVVQYGLLAMSVSLFPLLLLALAEPVGYTLGYIASAALVLVQASLYTVTVTKRAVPALAFAGMLAGLFAFIYVLLGLESYSLVVGALSLFAVVSAIMVLTQKVNWFGRTPVSSATSPPASATDAMA
jgi:inner membrane protein